ncbi:MAG: hypothetical protein M3N14_02170 [Bacteroidota bacterium]|nr:hypothetical protein [Bacteroidota bacterium]
MDPQGAENAVMRPSRINLRQPVSSIDLKIAFNGICATGVMLFDTLTDSRPIIKDGYKQCALQG